MAQNWYLLQPPYQQTSGFEDELIDDYTQEGFLEALDSSFADSVELYNYDLSQCQQIRAIVQNNTQDTKLKTLTRQILVPIGTCQTGMYIKYKQRFWLITGLVDDNKIHEKAIMNICNHLLTWLNEEGNIVQRWANVISATQYNSGEDISKFFTLRNDQLMLLIPNDDECLLLNCESRFIIDARTKVYEQTIPDGINVDTNKKVITYKLTRPDSVEYDFQTSGIQQILVGEDEKQPDDGYYVIGNNHYWLCGKPKVLFSDNNSICKIGYSSLTLYNGLEPCLFTSSFYNSTGELVEVTPQWNIICSFISDLEITYIDNDISIMANNKSLNNKSFTLSLSGEGYAATTIVVEIKAFI